MRVTQWGELGVLCAIEVAKHASEESPSISAAGIAAALRIDMQYAQQILHRLKKGEILKSTRGPRGGYELDRAAADTTLGQILNAAEGQTFEVFCETKPLDAERCDPGNACNLRPIWMQLRNHINEFLDRVTLDDLTRSPVEQILVQISGAHAEHHHD